MTADKPNPLLTFQGAGMTLIGGTIAVGPFRHSYPAVSFGHVVAYGQAGDVPQIILRPAASIVESDPCTDLFGMRYDQNGTEWEMVFRITTDPKGGLIGTSFSLETESNFPQTPMSIAKIEINQPTFGALVSGFLPASYLATLVTRFWDNGRTDLPLDAWLLLEIGYIPSEWRDRQWEKEDEIPLEVIGEVVLYPAHQGSEGPVLGDNYPNQARARRTS